MSAASANPAQSLKETIRDVRALVNIAYKRKALIAPEAIEPFLRALEAQPATALKDIIEDLKMARETKWGNENFEWCVTEDVNQAIKDLEALESSESGSALHFPAEERVALKEEIAQKLDTLLDEASVEKRATKERDVLVHGIIYLSCELRGQSTVLENDSLDAQERARAKA